MNIQLLLVNLLHIFNDGFQASFLLLLPFIAKDLHISLTQIGGLGSVLYVIETILALPSGYVGSRYNGIKILTVLMLIFGLGFLGLIFVFSFYSLLIPFLLIGIAYGFFHPIGFALVAKWADKKSRGRDVGDFTALGDVGRVILPAIITFVAAVVGWKLTALGYGVSAILLFVVILLFYHYSKHTFSEEKSTHSTIRIRDILKNKRFIIAVSAAALDSVASSSLFLFLPFLLLQKGINASILGSFAAAYFVGNLLGKSTIGRLADRYGNAIVFMVTEIFMAICIVLLTISPSPLFIIIFSIMLGALTKGTIPARSSMMIETIEHHGRYEKAISVMAFIIALVGSIAPAMYGRIADVWGINWTFYASAFFAIIATIPALIFKYSDNKNKQAIAI